jgi:4-amino-4-deoxy-L-arabinose transferase-like glycosyltransferase
MADLDDFYRRHEKWLIGLLLVFGFFMFFYNVGARDIWNPDEDEYIQVNREMVEYGRWLYPTVNERPYSIKPPLFNWLGSLVSLANGEVNEVTSRVPSATAATLGLLLVYWIGRMLFRCRVGLLSALILGTTPLYVEFGRWIQINMISTVLLVTTLGLFYWGYMNERRRPLAYLLMYVPVGLGVLNMGLVNVAMPSFVIGTYLLVVNDLKHVFQLRLIWGILIALAVAAPWYAIVCQQDAYADNLLMKTNFTRYFGKFQHARPFYYYLTTTPPYFFPWIFYLPTALIGVFSSRTRDDRKKLLFLFVWIASLFVFFSVSKTKRSEYMLPIYPALALLTGYTLDRAMREMSQSEFWRKGIVWPTRALMGLLALVAIGMPIYTKRWAEEWFLLTLPVAVLVLLGAISLFVNSRKSRGMPIVLTLVAVLLGTVVYGSGRQRSSPTATPLVNSLRQWTARFGIR